MKLLIIVFLLLLFESPAEAETYQYVNANGRTVYTNSPPDSRNVGDYSQPKKYQEKTIGEFCRNKWGMDFVMQEHCISKQQEARQRLYKYPNEITEFCRNKWHDDLEMVAYCADNQNSAKNRLR